MYYVEKLKGTIMLEVQKYLQTHILNDLFTSFGIRFKIYDDRVILKYGIDSKPKFHPIITECRGLILSLPDYKVLARGFDRFFNYGEGEDKETFNWDNCIVFNKLDGSLCKVYHDGIKWCVSTNGTAFAEGETPMGKTYHDLFVEAIGMDLQKGFEHCAKHYTYIFELTSPENRIVTRYSETKATLLAVRSNFDSAYVLYDILEDTNMFTFKCNLTESYDLNSPEDIIDFVEGRDAMDEGVVCYDTITQKRIKIKNASYVAIHHLRGNEVTKKSMLALVLKGEVEEYLTYFPEDFDVITPIMMKFKDLKIDIVNTYTRYYQIEDQKEFALKVKDLNYSSYLFAMRKGGVDTLDKMLNIENLNRVFKMMEKCKIF